jgi:hypothetical protein
MANMSRNALELYLYMCSSDEIIKWLEGEGVTTVQQALDKLEPLVSSNIYSWARLVGSGNYGGTLGGTNNCVKIVIEHFKNKK